MDNEEKNTSTAMKIYKRLEPALAFLLRAYGTQYGSGVGFTSYKDFDDFLRQNGQMHFGAYASMRNSKKFLENNPELVREYLKQHPQPETPDVLMMDGSLVNEYYPETIADLNKKNMGTVGTKISGRTQEYENGGELDYYIRTNKCGGKTKKASKGAKVRKCNDGKQLLAKDENGRTITKKCKC